MNTQDITQRVAVRAVIIKDNKVLALRESQGYEGGSQHGKYDFPGGKVGIGESVHEALHREVREEIGTEVEILEPFYVDEWRPTVNGQPLQIIGLFYYCNLLDENITLSKDHDEYKWIPLSEYKDYPLVREKRRALDVVTANRTTHE